MSVDLVELVGNLGRPRVLVVGDLMLDRYIWGNAARISQEAPVLLLHADKREERLGGASSVATLLAALGADVAVAGIVGDDADGERVRQMLKNLGVDASLVCSAGDRPTTVKERYIGRAQQRHPQQIVRVDYEVRDPLDAATEARLLADLPAEIATSQAVLISDYDKGVCTPRLLKAIIAEAKRVGVPVLADPTRGGDYGKYAGCSAITPNRLEAGLAVGRTLATNDQALDAAEELLYRLGLEASIVTLDKDGMALADRSGRRCILPTRPRQVYDITGAGDMVLGVLGLALAAGADYPDAIRLANVAGGLEVEKIGVATVSRQEILIDLQHADANRQPLAVARKLRPLPELTRLIGERRQLGRRVAFTNGCFDVLHAGHVQYLHEARQQGDLLVVGLNSDASVRGLKGPTRPVNTLDARAVVLAGLEAVDFLAVFDAPTPLELIHALRPDVLVKGADYSKSEVVGGSFVESIGGRVHLASLRDGYSTTNMLQRMRAA